MNNYNDLLWPAKHVENKKTNVYDVLAQHFRMAPCTNIAIMTSSSHSMQQLMPEYYVMN